MTQIGSFFYELKVIIFAGQYPHAHALKWIQIRMAKMVIYAPTFYICFEKNDHRKTYISLTVPLVLSTKKIFFGVGRLTQIHPNHYGEGDLICP